VAERLNAAALKAVRRRQASRGFESHPLRLIPRLRGPLAHLFSTERGTNRCHDLEIGAGGDNPAGIIDAPVRVVDYDPDWPQRFAEEREALEAAIGDWAVGGIHHIGSTAVPELEAKPVIDILVGVEDLRTSLACFSPLAKLEYVYAPYLTKTMHWFCKPGPAQRTHHLHLVPVDSARFREELTFRNQLRSQPELAAVYAALKRELANRYECDREAYTEAKSEFIRNALDQELAVRISHQPTGP
jgi:GrpB-like predicted nucleotidyltransferase (UPF0157 family)